MFIFRNPTSLLPLEREFQEKSNGVKISSTVRKFFTYAGYVHITKLSAVAINKITRCSFKFTIDDLDDLKQ